VDGRTAVIVKIRPELPQEKMQQAQLAQAFRAPGVDGRPLLSDRDIRDSVLEFEYPDTVERNIDAQMLSATSKDVQKLIAAAQEQRWMEDHSDTVALAEKKLGEPMRVYPEDMAAIMTILQKSMQGAPGADVMLAQADQMAAGGGMGLPPGQGPVGPNPAAMPSQMMMSPEEALPDPTQLAQSQPRRGKPVNGPR